MTVKVKIQIPHCPWRDGRPRFVPGPAVRALGFKGEDLKTAAGAWLSIDQTVAWSADIAGQIAERRQVVRNGAARSPRHHASRYSIGNLVADALSIAGAEIDNGRRRRKRLAPATLHWYRAMADIILDDHATIWASPPAALSPASAHGLIEQIEAKRGLATARGVRATLSMAWGRLGAKRGLGTCPFAGLRLPVPTPRLRYAETHEINALVAAADATDRPEIGDAILLGAMTGQRQNDRLALAWDDIRGGSIRLAQKKTGAAVTVPLTDMLAARLGAAKARRANWRVNYPHVVLDEKRRCPFNADHYRRLFGHVRAAAITAGHNSLAGLRDQDLRDTAVTWLALAGCTIPQICAVTGHAETSATAIMRHYLGRHPDMARAAIANLSTWLETQGSVC